MIHIKAPLTVERERPSPRRKVNFDMFILDRAYAQGPPLKLILCKRNFSL